MTAPMMAPNGTRFGGWLLNTGDNSFGPVGDFDGDGQAEILVTSPWGIGIFEAVRRHLDAADDGAERHAVRRLAAQHRRQLFGPVGDFDGDGHAEILVTSPWGIGILKLSGSTFTVPMMAPNGTRFGGWLLNTADNPSARSATSTATAGSRSWSPARGAIGILKLSGGTLHGADDGAERHALRRLAAEYRRQPARHRADYDGDGRAEILVTSPWGVGILEQSGQHWRAPMMAPNGTRFGGWLLNTIDNDFGHGV